MSEDSAVFSRSGVENTTTASVAEINSDVPNVSLFKSSDALRRKSLAGSRNNVRALIPEEPLEIQCGEKTALLFVSKLCQGSKGPCILYGNEWLTPNELQYICGRETAKDWKRSIRHKGKSLKSLIAQGFLKVHPPICDCPGCRVSSPVVSDLKFIHPIFNLRKYLCRGIFTAPTIYFNSQHARLRKNYDREGISRTFEKIYGLLNVKNSR